MKMIKVA